MNKEKDTKKVEKAEKVKKAPLFKKVISEKKADKNELKALMDSQKKEMKVKTKALKDLRISLKGKPEAKQEEIKIKIEDLSKEIKALAKVQKTDLKKKKKDLKHKYKIASKAKKAELKQLKATQKVEITAQKNVIKEIKNSLKDATKEVIKSIKKNIAMQKSALKKMKKKHKKDINAIKKELKQLKAKMKKPKARIRFLPLLITIAVLMAIFYFVIIFLDGIVKKVVIDTVESSYGAKCDIEDLDVAFIDSYLLIEGFTLADKDKPMQNLFEFSRMNLDFDLTQLLLGRFVVDEISLEGFCLGTERTVSGELPKAKAKAEKKRVQQANCVRKANPEFDQAMNTVTAKKEEKPKNFIQETAEKFAPENLMNSFVDQLTLPAKVEEAKASVEASVDFWQTTLPELETRSAELIKQTEEVVAIYNSPNVTPQVIEEGVETTTALLNESEELYSQLDELFAIIEEDSAMVSTLSSDIQAAIDADTNFVTTEIEKITSFDTSDAEGIITSIVEDYIVSALGEYYPIVRDALGYLEEMKARYDSSVKIEEEPEGFKRLEGQTIVFNRTMPSFLIKNVKFSGSNESDTISVSGFIKDITHQPDLIGKPVTSNLAVNIAQYAVAVDGLVDVRTNTTNEMVEFDFTGDGLDTDFLKNPTTVGVPGVDGKMALDGALDIGKDGDFLVASKFIFDPVLLNTVEFEPPEVYEIYQNILSTIDAFYFDAEVGFSLTDGITINLATDADKKIFAGLETELNKVIEEVKISAENEVKARIAEYTEQFDSEIAQFNVAKAEFENIQNNLDKIQDDLKNSGKNYQDKIKKEAEAEIQKAKDEAKAKADAEAARIEAEAQKAIDDAKAKAEEEATNAAKNAIGGFLKGF